MPKGYIVASVEVVDPAISAVYTQKLMELLRSAGVRPLVVGGRGEALEGEMRPRNLILEFESYEIARDLFYGPDYSALKALRADSAKANIMLLEGV